MTATRQEMEAAVIESLVAKWGEDERPGVIRQVREMSKASVALRYAELTGDKPAADAILTDPRNLRRPARHCNEDGVS